MNDSSTRQESGLRGVHAQAVVETLLARREKVMRGASVEDGRRVALVIEGGGMRGVLSGAGGVALEQLGMRQVFDEVYATSAGAMNAAYLLSGQADLGITIYYEELATARFINPWRLWKIMNIDLIFSSIVNLSKPLDVAAIFAERARFLIAVTEYKTGTPRLIDVRDTRTALVDVLKAATSIPVLYNRLHDVDGVSCFDGGLSNPFPIRNAIERGCTDILVLMSRPEGFIRKPSGLFESMAFDALFAPRNRAIRSQIRANDRHDRECRDLALGRVPIPNGVRIATLCAADDGRVGRSTANAADLWAGAHEYGQRTMRELGFNDRAFHLRSPRGRSVVH